jgi:DNA-binding NtrC family response regulator
VASILIVGSDAALLEGVAQTLVGAGHQVVVAKDIPEALETLHGRHPLIALVHCEELIARAQMLHSALAHGGALLAFHCDEDERYTLPFNVKRTTLATLRLPLERQRLLALVRYIENRAHAAGRESIEGDDFPMERGEQI